jgi:hypothetical protein
MPLVHSKSETRSRRDPRSRREDVRVQAWAPSHRNLGRGYRNPVGPTQPAKDAIDPGA